MNVQCQINEISLCDCRFPMFRDRCFAHVFASTHKLKQYCEIFIQFCFFCFSFFGFGLFVAVFLLLPVNNNNNNKNYTMKIIIFAVNVFRLRTMYMMAYCRMFIFTYATRCSFWVHRIECNFFFILFCYFFVCLFYFYWMHSIHCFVLILNVAIINSNEMLSWY